MFAKPCILSHTQNMLINACWPELITLTAKAQPSGMIRQSSGGIWEIFREWNEWQLCNWILGYLKKTAASGRLFLWLLGTRSDLLSERQGEHEAESSTTEERAHDSWELHEQCHPVGVIPRKQNILFCFYNFESAPNLPLRPTSIASRDQPSQHVGFAAPQRVICPCTGSNGTKVNQQFADVLGTSGWQVFQS